MLTWWITFVIITASDQQPDAAMTTPDFVRNLLTRRAAVASDRRFSGAQLTGFGTLEDAAESVMAQHPETTPAELPARVDDYLAFHGVSVLDAIKTDPNVAPEFAAALEPAPAPLEPWQYGQASDSLEREMLKGRWEEMRQMDADRALIDVFGREQLQTEPYIGSKQEYYDDIRREFIESERDGDSDVRDDE